MQRGLVEAMVAEANRGSPPKRDQDSLVKARFASTVLRVAQTTDQQTAARLVRGLAHDFPHPDEHREVADAHLSAIETFFQLAANMENAVDFKQRKSLEQCISRDPPLASRHQLPGWLSEKGVEACAQTKTSQFWGAGGFCPALSIGWLGRDSLLICGLG